MLGVGAPEIFILAVVALVIFGPGKLPEVAGQVGRAVRDFRRMTADLTGEFERTIAEVDDVKESVRREVGGMRAEVEGVSKSVKKDLSSITETTGAKPSAPKKGAVGKGGGGRTAAKPKPNGVAAQASAEPVPIASKADPLADVSMLDDEPVVASSSGPIAKETKNASGTAKTNGTGTVAAPSNGKASESATTTAGDAVGEPAEAVVGAAPGVAAEAPSVVGDGAVEQAPLAAVGSSAPDEALIRARRRRAEAGYRRRA